MRRNSGSSSVSAMVVVAVGVIASAATWWVMGSGSPAPAVSAAGEVERSEIRAELAELRQVVEELRAAQSRAVFDARGPVRDLESAASEEAADGASIPAPKGEGELAKSGGGKKGAGKGEAFQTLQRMKNSEDVDERRALAEELLTSDDFWVRCDAIQELLQQDPAVALPALHELLAAAVDQPKGGYASVRAVNALGDVEGYAVDSDLRRIYAENEMKGVPLAAARALDRQGDSSLIQLEVGRFTQLLQSDDHGTRMWGIGGLGETGSASAVPHLMPLLGNSDVQLRIRAVQALGQTGGASEIAAIEAMLNDSVGAVRDSAVEALATLRRRLRR